VKRCATSISSLSDAVPERVVDHLEAVEVDEQHADVPVVAARVDQCLLQAQFQRQAVRQFGQRVVVRQEVDAFLGTLALGDVGEHRDVMGHAAGREFHDGVDRHPLRVDVAALAAVENLAGPVAVAPQGVPHLPVEGLVVLARGEDLRVLADHLVRRVAGDLREGFVHRNDAVLVVGDHDRFRAVVEDLLRQNQVFLGPPPLGHVRIDRDEAAARQRHAVHLDDRPVGPGALEVVGDRRAGPRDDLRRQFLRVARAIVATAGVEERQLPHRQRRFRDEFGREVEQARELGIEGDEVEVAVHQRNAARNVLDDGAQLLAAFAQVLLLAPRFGDVLDGAGGADRRAVGVAHDLAGVLEDALLAVGKTDAIVDCVRFAAGDRALHHKLHAGPIVRMDSPEEEVEFRLRHEGRRGVEEAIGLVGPPQLVGPEIPFPAADAADLLRLREAVGDALQLLARRFVALALVADQILLGLPEDQRDAAGDDDEEGADEDHQADALVQRHQHLALVDLGDQPPRRSGDRPGRRIDGDVAVIDAFHDERFAACGMRRRQGREAGVEREGQGRPLLVAQLVQVNDAVAALLDEEDFRRRAGRRPVLQQGIEHPRRVCPQQQESRTQLPRPGRQRGQQIHALAAVGNGPEIAEHGRSLAHRHFTLLARGIRQEQVGPRRHDDAAAAIDQRRVLVVVLAAVELKPAPCLGEVLGLRPRRQPAFEERRQDRAAAHDLRIAQPLLPPVIDLARLEVGDRGEFCLGALARGDRFRVVENVVGGADAEQQEGEYPDQGYLQAGFGFGGHGRCRFRQYRLPSGDGTPIT